MHQSHTPPGAMLLKCLPRSKRNIIPCVPDGWTASTLADHLKVGDVRVFEMMKVVGDSMDKGPNWSGSKCIEITKPDRLPSPSNHLLTETHTFISNEDFQPTCCSSSMTSNDQR
ncbi:hypothetical protein Peur_072042 [Populus x canadensis]